VIDPLFRLARIRDEKAYAETYYALGPLIDVAREAGTHVMLTHHAGKSAKADAIDSPLGSTAIGGAVSTLIHLKRTETMRTIQTVQRIY
jgi:RecA-family ATPase